MRDHHHFLFFADRISGDLLELDRRETRHAVSVLRTFPSDPFMATDGAGTVFECIFEATSDHRLSGKIISRTIVSRHPCSIQILIGLPERDAFERLISDLTALGIEQITPLVSACCQKPWWEKGWENLSERFRGKMVSAMKQSRYPWLPQLDPPLPFGDFRPLASQPLLVADKEGMPISAALGEIRNPDAAFACIIGPPGGFSPEETAAFSVHRGLPVKIAASRLTSELASVVLASQIIGAKLG